MKKKGLKYWLSIISAACCIVYLLLRIFGIIDNRMHLTSRYHAYAAGFDTVTLTPEQTIGLYGVSLDVTYTGIDNVDKYFTAYLNGVYSNLPGYPTTSADPRLWSVNDWGPFNGLCNILWYYPQDPVTAFDYSLKHKEYIVYSIAFPKGTFYSHSSIAHPNIRIDIDYNIPFDCKFMESWVMFGRDPAARDSGWTYVQHKTTPSSGYSQMMPSGGLGNGLTAYTPYPDYYPVSTDEGQGCNPMGVIAAGFGDKFGDTLYRATGEQWTLNGCAIAPYMSTPIADYFLIYISCPTLYMDYTPPIPETTEPEPATTRADFTTYNYTYDLSPLETNQQNQIRIQNQQLQIEMAQLDGINYICRKLDQIYNEMVERGEIPVNLIPAQTLPRDSDIQDFISHQTSFTLAQLPPDEYFDNAETLTDLMREFTNRFSWFYILGMFSLAMCVVCWIIFKGRG